jgi:hypothetical protein
MTKWYDVLIIPARPACNDHGSVVEVQASSKAKAIAEARKINSKAMFYDRHDGKLIYTATETN